MKNLSLICIILISVFALGCTPPSDPESKGNSPDAGKVGYVNEANGNLFGVWVGNEVYYIPRYEKMAVIDAYGIKADMYPCSYSDDSFSSCNFAGRFSDSACTVPHIPTYSLASKSGSAIILVGKTEQIFLIKNSNHRNQAYYVEENDECIKKDFIEDAYAPTAFENITPKIKSLPVGLPLTFHYN